MDSIDLFIRTLSFSAPLPEKLREQSGRHLSGKNSKKTLLLREGEIVTRIYFINEGFARYFYFKRVKIIKNPFRIL